MRSISKDLKLKIVSEDPARTIFRVENHSKSIVGKLWPNSRAEEQACQVGHPLEKLRQQQSADARDKPLQTIYAVVHVLWLLCTPITSCQFIYAALESPLGTCKSSSLCPLVPSLQYAFNPASKHRYTSDEPTDNLKNLKNVFCPLDCIDRS